MTLQKYETNIIVENRKQHFITTVIIVLNKAELKVEVSYNRTPHLTLHRRYCRLILRRLHKTCHVIFYYNSDIT